MNPDNFTRYIQAFLAVVITIGFFAVIAILFYKTDIPSPVKDILLVMLGALLASWKEITGYFFGSSSGSARKDEQNAALSAQIAATPVAATASALGAGPTGTPSDPVSVVTEDNKTK